MQSFDQHNPIYRRAEFLLNEARHNAQRDQAITFTMRVLSNHATVGRDVGSGQVKDRNLRVSKSSRDFLESVGSVSEWRSSTINEHPFPLKASWEFIIANAMKLTVEQVWEHFAQNPMITIKIEEDRKLNKLGLRSSNDRNRYAKAGIEITELSDLPIDTLKRRFTRQLGSK